MECDSGYALGTHWVRTLPACPHQWHSLPQPPGRALPRPCTLEACVPNGHAGSVRTQTGTLEACVPNLHAGSVRTQTGMLEACVPNGHAGSVRTQTYPGTR